MSRRAWRRAARTGYPWPPSARQVLADDIVRCRQLRGMTYDEVRALLGRPSSPGDGAQGSFMTWDIGLERDSLFPIDQEQLVVRFDADGRFTSAGMQSS